MNLGIIQGNGEDTDKDGHPDLDMSNDLLRTLVILDRCGLIKKS